MSLAMWWCVIYRNNCLEYRNKGAVSEVPNITFKQSVDTI